MTDTQDLVDPTVRAVVTAINDGDRSAFLATCTPDVTLTDDGTERDFEQWIDREIFSSNGRIDVETQSDDGRSLVARYSNDTWGEMLTSWTFTVSGDKVTRIATGQA